MMESIEKLREFVGKELYEKERIGHGDYSHLHVLIEDVKREITEKYMLLPVDADGVPIHVGDELMTSEYSKRFTCTGYSYQTEGYEKPHWSIAYRYDDYDGTTEFVSLRSCRHVNPRTIEDVLKAFFHDALDADAYCTVHIDDVIAKYADELRQMGVGV